MCGHLFPHHRAGVILKGLEGFWRTRTSNEFGLVALENSDHMPGEFGPIPLENSA